MKEMKLSWLIGQMISILYATLTTTYQSKYPIIHMLWQTEVFCIIVVMRQEIIFFLNLWLHVRMQIQN